MAVEWILQNLLFYNALFGFVVNLGQMKLLTASLRRAKSGVCQNLRCAGKRC
ncbi:MAG: hypothetical protein CLLPBCKN_007136 [Chroococcidiopsis cubana SAG 39.79]|nr:hypothetical protein [Chroococcidiopsis cubana SAG 39.79]